MQHQSIKRRDFLKWSGIAGGAAMLAPSLLVGCSPQQEPLSQTSDAPDTSGYIMDAVSDGLPYGADKVCPVMCTNGDACGELHCGAAYVKDGAIIHYEGCLESHNKGGLCARGMTGLDIIYHPDRIKYPMRRTNEKGVKGEFERISWEEAIETISEAMAKAIREEGPQTIAAGFAHPGNYASNSTAAVFCKLFNASSPLGPDCWHDLQFGPSVTLGDMYHSLEADPLDSKLIILWGENTTLSKPQEWAASYGRAMHEFGAKLVVIDSRVSETANKANIYLPVRPGTDAYVALAMANVIIEENLQDQEFIDAHTYGYDEFAALVKKYTPEEVQKISWAPADKIREIARLYAKTKPALIAIGRGGNSAGGKNSNAGWMMSRAITCLIGLCGQAGVKGSGVSIETSSGNPGNLFYHWPKSLQMTAPAAGTKPLIEATQKANPGIWGKRDLLYKREPFGYRVYINNGNFAASSGNQDDAEEAFKKIDLVVVNNRLIHWTASAFADILLPVASWAEQYTFRPDWEAMAMTPPAIEPLFESVSDVEVYRRISNALAKKLDLGDNVWPFETDEDYMTVFVANDKIKSEYKKRADEGLDAFKEYADITFNQVLSHPEGVPNPFYAGLEDFVPFKAKVYSYNNRVPSDVDPESIWFPTDGDTGKLLFKADFLPEQSGGILPALPIPSEPDDSYYASGNPIESGDWNLSSPVSNGFKYVAVGKAHSFWQFLSFNQNLDGGPASLFLREAFIDAAEPCVKINPADGSDLGIENGDIVIIESQYGKMENLKAILTETVMPGTVVPPTHWGINQSKLYQTSRSLESVEPKLRGKILPPFVGEFGNDERRGAGGITNQTGALCKIYKA